MRSSAGSPNNMAKKFTGKRYMAVCCPKFKPLKRVYVIKVSKSKARAEAAAAKDREQFEYVHNLDELCVWEVREI